MAPGFKTGGRTKGTPNKPRPITLAPTEANRELLAKVAVMKTPKHVMLEAMVRFENIGASLLANAKQLAETNAGASALEIARLTTEGHKYIIAAVECAKAAAPYVHARLLAIESRGDMAQDEAPIVIRAPAVHQDSEAWAVAVRAEANEREAVHVANGGQLAALPDRGPSAPPTPNCAQVAKPVALVADQKSDRISTRMPAGPIVLKPNGTQEWLESVAADQRRRASGPAVA
jgi:hypothetical protein